MKKITLLFLFLTFSISVSATENTTVKEESLTENILLQENFEAAYYYGNGGFLQFVYNIFHKVGEVIYNTVNGDDEEKKKEENTTK